MSPFARQVLAATAKVDFGHVSTYGQIAKRIGRPTASRSVGAALGSNPIPIVVPCHRIVGVGGDLVGYAGDRIGLKERLLAVEGVPTLHGRTSRIERRGMYHYDPNPDRQYCLPTCGTILERPIGQVKLFARRELAEAIGLGPSHRPFQFVRIHHNSPRRLFTPACTLARAASSEHPSSSAISS